MLPDDRRELWLLGLGLGLCSDAGLLLAAVFASWPLNVHTLPRWAAVGVSVTTLGLFGLPLAIYGLRGLWIVASTLTAAWNAPAGPTAPTDAQITRQEDTPEEEAE